MHLVKTARSAHRVRLDIMDPRPGIKWSGRSRRIKWIQSVVYRIYSVRLFSHLMQIAPELGVIVGCAQAMQIIGGLGGLLCNMNSTLPNRGRYSSTASFHAASVVKTPVEWALIEHSCGWRGKSWVHGRRLVLNTHLTGIIHLKVSSFGWCIGALRWVLELVLAVQAAHLDGPSPWIVSESVFLDRMAEACFAKRCRLCQWCHRLRWMQREGVLLKG